MLFVKCEELYITKTNTLEMAIHCFYIKKIILQKKYYVFLILLSTIDLSGQILEDGTLENWQQSQSNLYEQPTSDFWVTLNALADLGGPVTVEKTTDACEGIYAAKLTTKNFTNLLISGLLASGNFNQSNLVNPLNIGKPFPLKPFSFTGCYKYIPINNDSAALVSILTKWNNLTNTRDTIAIAGGTLLLMQNEYIDFNYPYDYLSQETPDSIQIIFSSSAGGNNNLGQLGSTLWVDNVAVNLSNSITLNFMAESPVKCYPNPAENNVVFDLQDINENGILTLYNSEGKEILVKSISIGLNEFSLNNLSTGFYLYTIKSQNTPKVSGILLHN